MTTDTQKNPGKILGVVGILFGVFLYFLWFVAIMAIMFTFFAPPDAMGVFTVTFPLWIRTWLTAGTLPSFMLFGHYLFCRGTMTKTDLIQNRSGLIGSFLGFLLWLGVLIVLEVLGIAVQYPHNLVGGFLAIFFLYVIFRKFWNRK